MDLRQLFAANLRRLRHAKKLSQEALAHDAGIDRAYLSRIERAATYVGLEIIERLAAVLGVDAGELLAPLPKPARKAAAGKRPGKARRR